MEIFFLVLFAFVPLIMLVAVIYFIVEKYPIISTISCFILFCIFVFLWITCFNDYRKNNNLANVYTQKVQDVQKANRELQKFLIDHPEFKESE